MKHVILNYLKVKSQRLFLYAGIWAFIAAFISIFIDPQLKLLFLCSFGYLVKGYYFHYIENRKIILRGSVDKRQD